MFEDIVGQSHITRTLKNQILTGKIAHAYLFCGTRGTGKTTAAKVFSRAVNCTNNTTGSPCNECEVCRGILNGSILEVSEIDAASNNSVEDIRAIQDELSYSATQSKYRVYIIDEVHMLSMNAFNALLKTLEEPPEHVIFILATTEVHKLPQTILSRCQRFDFKRIKPSDIILRMKEIARGDGLNISDDAYSLLAKLADGSMRDGLSVLERCVAACGNSLGAEDIVSVLGIATSELTFDTAAAVIAKDAQKIISIINTLTADGRDLNSFVDGVISHFRDLLICKVSQNPEETLDYSADDILKLRGQSERASFEKISNVTSVLSKARSDAKWVKNPRVIYELAFIKLTRPELDDSKEALLDRLSEVEEKIKNGVEVKTAEKSKAKKSDEKKKPKKEKPPERIFKPVNKESLTAENPIVVTARNWSNILQSVLKNAPHLMLLRNKRITVDGEGIIVMFEASEIPSKAIIDLNIGTVEELVQRASGCDIRVKTAQREDIEDYIIDFWSLPNSKNAENTTLEETAKKAVPENDGAAVTAENENADPLDSLAERFPEIVEFTDDSEFINYNSDGEHFEQASIESTEDDDDREEFLERSESGSEDD